MKAIMAILVMLLFNPMTISQSGAISIEKDRSVSVDPTIDIDINGSGHYFIENRGQFPAEIDYMSKTDFGHVAVGPAGLFYHVISGSEGENVIENVVTVQFQNSGVLNPVGSDEMDMKCNFFLGNDPDRWVSGVSVYRSVEINGIYPDIDARLYFKEGRFKYDLLVGPESNPSEIKMRYHGQSGINVGSKNIGLELPGGVILNDGNLFTYSKESGKKISSRYIKDDCYTISFSLDNRPKGETLVIDPLVYSTYIGGSDSDIMEEMDSSENGTVYLGGRTLSTNFPTTAGSYKRNFSVNETSSYHDIFLMRMDPTGRYPLYSTFFGGKNGDFTRSMDIASDGSVVFCGYTNSNDLPVTKGSFNDSAISGGSKGFIARISKDGSSLIFSTLLWYTCIPEELLIHQDRGIVFVGYGNSSYAKPMNTTLLNGSKEGVLIGVLTLDGTDVVHSSVIGGSSYAGVQSMVMDDELLTVFGYTYSANFPNNTRIKMCSSYDLYLYTYIFSYDLGTGSFENSTLLTCIDWMSFILGGPDDEIYIIGNIRNGEIEGTENAIDKTYNGKTDLFIMSLNDSWTGLDYFTYFGGSGSESITSAYFDRSGMLVVGGFQNGGHFPVTNDSWARSTIGASDIFISILDLINGTVIHSTLLGSTTGDSLNELMEGPDGRIIAGGATWSTQQEFPITDDAFQDGKELGGISMFFLHYTPPRVASAPRNLSYVLEQRFREETHDITITGINLSWDEPLDWGDCKPIGYRILRWQEGEEPVVLNDNDIRNETYYHDDNLRYTGRKVFDYYYRVYAITEYDVYSEPSTIRIEDREGPYIYVYDIPEYEDPGSTFDPDVKTADPSGIEEIWFQYWYDEGEHHDFVYHNETINRGRLFLDKVLGTINFIVFARDTFGNLNWTDVYSVPMRDLYSPVLARDYTPNNIEAGEVLSIKIKLRDNHMIEDSVVQIKYGTEDIETYIMNTEDEINWTYGYQTRRRPGNIQYRFRIYDPSGNHLNTTWKEVVTTGSDKPIITMNWTPERVYVGEDIIFKVNINDSRDLKRVWIEADFGDYDMTYVGDDNWSYAYRWTGEFDEIEYCFYYTTKWNSTYCSLYNGLVRYIDTIMPEILSSTDITNRNITTGSTWEFRVEGSDDFGVRLARINYRCGDQDEMRIGLEPEGEGWFYKHVEIPKSARYFSYNFTIFDFGWNTVNSTTRNVSVYDNIDPWISGLDDTSCSTNDESIRIYFFMNDNVGIDDYWYRWKNSEQNLSIQYDDSEYMNRPYIYFKPGSKTSFRSFRVYIKDLQGNIFESDEHTIEVKDKTPPRFGKIKDYVFRAEEEFRIELDIDDNMAINHVEWDGIPLKSNDEVLEGSIDERGIYKVKVTAYDSSGNTASHEFLIFIESPEKDIEPGNLWIIYLLVSIIVVLLTIMIVQMVIIHTISKNDIHQKGGPNNTNFEETDTNAYYRNKKDWDRSGSPFFEREFDE